MMKYFVYELKRQAGDADPFYIGLTRDPETRSRHHKQKHGLSIQFAILHEFGTEEEAMAKETELIKWHSEHGNILNLRGVKGTRQARKGMHSILTAKRAERKRLRAEHRARLATEYEDALKTKRSAERQRQAKVEASIRSVSSVAAAFVVLRGLLTGIPTQKEMALEALEIVRRAPGAMELARVYIKANII